MIKSKGGRGKIDVERYDNIGKLLLEGKTYYDIGIKFGITKQRISQIAKILKIHPITIRQEVMFNKVKEALNSGVSIVNVRNNFKLKTYDIEKLLKNGVDVRLVKRDEIKKVREKCLPLYKRGLTANEILNIVPEIKTATRLYVGIKTINNGKVPKRINTRTKKAITINKEIVRLKKKNSFYDVHSILVEKGFKNLNGGELKLESVISAYYRWQKK